MINDESMDRQIGVKLRSEDIERIKRLAAKEQLTLAAWCRRELVYAVERLEAKKRAG